VLALLIRVAEGNGSAMLSVASATMILESFESATGLMYVSITGYGGHVFVGITGYDAAQLFSTRFFID